MATKNLLGLGFSFSATDRGLGTFVKDMSSDFGMATNAMDTLAFRSQTAEKVLRATSNVLRYMGDDARETGKHAVEAFTKAKTAAEGASQAMSDYARGDPIRPALKDAADQLLLLKEYSKAAGKELPANAEKYAQSLIAAGMSAMDLHDKIAVELPAAAQAAGESIDDYVMNALKGAAEQLQRGAPLMEVVDTLGIELPEAAKESEEASESLGKEGSAAFGKMLGAMLKLNKMGIGKLKQAVSGLGMAFMGATRAGTEFVGSLGKAGIRKISGQIQGLASDLSSLPGQLTSGINLTTGFEAQMAQLGKGAKKAAAQMGLTGKKAKEFTGKAAGMAYSLDVSEESAMKALRANEAYAEQLEVLGLMDAKDLVKFGEVFGVEGDVIGRQTYQMKEALHLTNEEIKGIMSSAAAAGEEMWDIPAAMQQMDALLPILETQRTMLGKTEAEVASFGQEFYAASGAFYQITNNSDEAMQHAMALTNVITDSSLEWERMLGGLGEMPGLMEAATKAGIDAKDVLGMMKEGPAGFMQAMSKLRFNELEEGSELLQYIQLQLAESLGGDMAMAQQTIEVIRKMSAEGEDGIKSVMGGIMTANKDFGKMAREGFSTGRTLQEMWERQVDSFVAGFRKHGRPAARAFVRDSGKEFKKFNKQLTGIVEEGGPMGQLVTKFSEIHQLGVLAMIPESVRPAAAAFGTMFENMTPVLSSLQMMGIRVADLATPTAALTAGIGALVFAYMSAREESEKTVESLAKGGRAMRKNDAAIKSLEKQLGKAEKGTKEFDAIQRRLDKRMSEANLAKAMKADNIELAKQQKLLKKATKYGKDTTDIQAKIAKAEEGLAATRLKIQEQADERTREGIKRMFKTVAERVKLFIDVLPDVLRSAWPEIRKIFSSLGTMILDGLVAAAEKSLAGGGFIGMVITKIIATLKDLGTKVGAEMEAIFDPKKGAESTIGKLFEGIFKVITELGPQLLFALLNAVAYIDFGKVAGQLASIVVKVVTFVVDTIVKYAPMLIRGLLDAFAEAFPMLVKGLRDLIPLLPPLLVEIGNLIAYTLVPMLPGIVSDLASLLTELFTTFLPSLTTTLVQVISALAKQLPGIIGTLADTIGSVWGTLIESVAQLVIGALPSVVTAIAASFPKVMGLLLDMFVTEFKGLAMMITQLDLGGMVMQLINSILYVVQDLLSGDFLATVVTTFASMIGPVGQALIQVFTRATSLLAGMDWTGIMDGIMGAVDALVAALPVILPPLLKAIIDAIPVILTNLINVGLRLNVVGMQMIAKLSIAIVSAIAQMAPSIAGALFSLLYTVIPKTVIRLVGTLKSTLMNTVWPAIQSVGESIKSFFLEAIPNMLLAAGDAIRDYFVKPFVEVIDWLIGNSIIVDMFQAGVDRIIGIFTELGAGVVSFFSWVGEMVMGAVTGYMDLLYGFWSTIFGGIIDIAMWAGYQLVAFVTDPIGWIQDAWYALPDIFWGVFESVKTLVSDAVGMIVGWVDEALGMVEGAAEGVYNTFEYLFGSSVHTFIRDDLAQAEAYTTQWADHTGFETNRAFGGMTSRSRQFRDRAKEDAEAVQSAWAAAEGMLAQGRLGKALGGEGVGGFLKGLPGQASALLGGKTPEEKAAEAAAKRDQIEANIAKAAQDQSNVQVLQEKALAQANLLRLEHQKEMFDNAVAMEKELNEGMQFVQLAAAAGSTDAIAKIAEVEAAIASAYEQAGVTASAREFGKTKDVGQGIEREIDRAQQKILDLEAGKTGASTPGGPRPPGMKPPGAPKTMGAMTAPRTTPVNIMVNAPSPSITELISNDLASLDINLLTWQSLTQIKMATTAENIAESFEGMTTRISDAFYEMWLDILDVTAIASGAISDDASAAASDLEGILGDLRQASRMREKIDADEIAAEAPTMPLIGEGEDPLEVVAQTVNMPDWYTKHYEPLFTAMLSEIKSMNKSEAKGGRKTGSAWGSGGSSSSEKAKNLRQMRSGG